ncbi:MAG: hypothetical protein ACR2LJ_01190 [Acidimicrobiales bacterium]
MLVSTATTPAPILPGNNGLLELAMWVLAAATLAFAVLLLVLAVRGTGWLVGYQLGKLKHPSR